MSFRQQGKHVWSDPGKVLKAHMHSRTQTATSSRNHRKTSEVKGIAQEAGDSGGNM